MTEIIIDLWNGNVAPGEYCGSNDPLANDLLELMEKNRGNLSQGLTAAQMELFQKYIDCAEEYLARMLELAFCDGFTTGSKLIMEVLQ